MDQNKNIIVLLYDEYNDKIGNKLKQIDIGNFIYYFFEDMISIDANKIKIDDKSHKNIFIYLIRYLTVKYFSYGRINSVNFLYRFINNPNGYIKGCDRKKYLTLVPTDEIKDTPKKYKELQSEIRCLIN